MGRWSISENNATLSEDWMEFSDRSSVAKVRQQVGGWVGGVGGVGWGGVGGVGGCVGGPFRK